MKPLTARESEILKLLAEGATASQIASSLRRSPKTIEAHVYNLMRKLDLHKRAHLVVYAIQHKIIKVPKAGAL